jgi:sporulation protein YabP
MGKENMRHTALTVKERNKITLNGVTNVVTFDNDYVTLETNEGKIFIEGQGLKIESLSQESGEIHITGRIDGVFYAKEKKAKNGFARLFG